jgi:trk system potassium uptake protein TrkA
LKLPLEFVAAEGSPVTRGPLKTIKFPKNSIVGAVYNGDEVVLAGGETHIKAGERVIVFCHATAVKKLQGLFTCR